MLNVEAAESRDSPSVRLGEARKQIHLAIEGCDEDVDVSDLQEVLRIINEFLDEADSGDNTH